ncbi:MAG: hypothetical protein WEB53_01595 [Akkermansiaceae bacterium]
MNNADKSETGRETEAQFIDGADALRAAGSNGARRREEIEDDQNWPVERQQLREVKQLFPGGGFPIVVMKRIRAHMGSQIGGLKKHCEAFLPSGACILEQGVEPVGQRFRRDFRFSRERLQDKRDQLALMLPEILGRCLSWIRKIQQLEKISLE